MERTQEEVSESRLSDSAETGFDGLALRGALAFVSACTWFFAFTTGGFGAGFEAPAIARSLVLTGHFADPFRFPTGPTAHLPPVFPAFLALLMFVFRTPEWVVMSAILSAALASAVLVASLPALSSILIGRRQPGIYAACAAIAIPLLPLYPHWDANFTAAAVAIFTIACHRLSKGSPLSSLLLGFFTGLITLLSPIAAITAICSFLFFAVQRRNLARSLPVFTLALVATISPWIYRNWLVFDRLIPVRDNLGLELSVYNGDSLDDSSHPNQSAAEAARARSMGETAYNDARLREAFAWIKSHQPQFAARTATRIVEFWFPPLSSSEHDPSSAMGVRLYSASAWLLTLLALPGLLLLRRNRALPLITLTLCPLLYYVTLPGIRYRSPIAWVLMLLAGLTIEWVTQHLPWRPAPR